MHDATTFPQSTRSRALLLCFHMIFILCMSRVLDFYTAFRELFLYCMSRVEDPGLQDPDPVQTPNEIDSEKSNI